MAPQTKVFIGSLPQGSRPEELRKLFERFGEVTECDIMNRCGFVHMQTEDQAAEAILALHNTTFNGGVITVERGRIKERGQRGPSIGGGGRGGGGGGRGGRGGRGGGGPMRGGHGSGRDAPYVRERSLRGPMGGYDRGMDSRASAAPYNNRYNGYGGEDRRGFALSRDSYAPAPGYDDRRGYAAPVDDMGGMYPEEHRQPMYQDDMYDRRAPMSRGPMPISSGYDRAAPRSTGMGNGDMYSRRAPSMRGPPESGGYERDPYAQSYTPRPRGGGAPRGAPRGGTDGGMRHY